MINFERDIKDVVLNALPRDPAFQSTLDSKSASDLLIIYFNWLERLIPASPRKIFFSREILSSPLGNEEKLKSSLDHIYSLIENGGDLTPYLSRGVKVGFDVQQGHDFNRRRDLDLMLNDWGVHHLHLSTTMESDGFASRTGPLLFGIFRPTAAYLIDVFPHGSWTKQTIMEIVAREWPKEGLVHEIQGAVGLSQRYSDTDRKKLRGGGLNAPLEINGKVYMSASLGSTTAGTGLIATMKAQNLLRSLEMFAKKIETDPHWLAGQIFAAGKILNPPPTLKFVFLADGRPAVVETSSAVAIPL